MRKEKLKSNFDISHKDEFEYKDREELILSRPSEVLGDFNTELIPGFSILVPGNPYPCKSLPVRIRTLLINEFKEIKRIRKIDGIIDSNAALMTISLAYVESLKFNSDCFKYFYNVYFILNDRLKYQIKNTIYDHILNWKGIHKFKMLLLELMKTSLENPETFLEEIKEIKPLYNVFLQLGTTVIKNYESRTNESLRKRIKDDIDYEAIATADRKSVV